MKDKKLGVRNALSTVGLVAIWLYILVALAGRQSSFLAMRTIIALVALIAYSIKCGMEISCEENFKRSAIMMLCCIVDIVLTVLLMAA